MRTGIQGLGRWRAEGRTAAVEWLDHLEETQWAALRLMVSSQNHLSSPTVHLPHPR